MAISGFQIYNSPNIKFIDKINLGLTWADK